jgi:hypothetical protein
VALAVGPFFELAQIPERGPGLEEDEEVGSPPDPLMEEAARRDGGTGLVEEGVVEA